MYDGQRSMVRTCCAVEWCGVVDVGLNRIRGSCRNTPAFGSAFCPSCLRNRCTVKRPNLIQEENKMDFVNELQQMKYLEQGEFFIECITDTRVKKNSREVQIKWVGYHGQT